MSFRLYWNVDLLMRKRGKDVRDCARNGKMSCEVVANTLLKVVGA